MTNVNNCTQLIIIEGVFDYQVILPGDTRATCPVAPALADVQVAEGACDMIMVDSQRDTVPGGAGCFDIEITHTITNLCEYDGSGRIELTRAGLAGLASDDLYLNVASNSANGTTDDVAFVSGDADRQFRPATQNDAEVAGYAANANRGGFSYVQTISIFDRTSPTVTLTQPVDCLPGCSADFNTFILVGDECLEPTVVATFDGDPALGVNVNVSPTGNGGFQIDASDLPAGVNGITLTVTDACGNVTTETINVEVCGDVAPTPICITTLTVVLVDDGMGGGTAEVWANDFIASPIADCFGNDVERLRCSNRR